MIIDTQKHSLSIRLVKQLMTMLGNGGFVDSTNVEFHYYPGSGWTVDVVQDEEEETKDAKPTPWISTLQPPPEFNITLTSP